MGMGTHCPQGCTRRGEGDRHPLPEPSGHRIRYEECGCRQASSKGTQGRERALRKNATVGGRRRGGAQACTQARDRQPALGCPWLLSGGGVPLQLSLPAGTPEERGRGSPRRSTRRLSAVTSFAFQETSRPRPRPVFPLHNHVFPANPTPRGGVGGDTWDKGGLLGASPGEQSCPSPSGLPEWRRSQEMQPSAPASAVAIATCWEGRPRNRRTLWVSWVSAGQGSGEDLVRAGVGPNGARL